MTPSFLLEDAIRLDDLFERYRNRPALIADSASRSFGDVEERLYSVLAHLQDAGVRKGNSVALHGANSELHLYLFLASWMMDFLYIPLDFKAPLSALLSDTPVDFLVTDTRSQMVDKCIVVSPDKLLSGCLIESGMTLPGGFHNTPPSAIPFDQEACAIFTSGSTGHPRGIVHTVGNYLFSALGTNEFIGLESFDRWLLSLPLFHVGGVLIWVRTLLAGATCILPDPHVNLDNAIRQHRPTVISLVPAQLIRLIENDEMISIMRNMKTIMLGGAPSPGWLINKSINLGLPIMPTYGCTESCAQVTGVVRGSSRHAYHTTGKVLPYRDIRISDNGIILLGGKTLFKRYLHEPVASSFDSNGFFKTADSGRFDDKGNVIISGRTDGVFISGGENIAPQEIEQALLKLDGVITAIVVPAPHREFGLTPWAFVETLESFNEKDMLDNLRKHMPGYKLPKRIIRLSPDHLQGKMKVSREKLTELARSLACDHENMSQSKNDQQLRHSRLCPLGYAGGNPDGFINADFHNTIHFPGSKKKTLRNTHLHYEETGHADAPALVFLHGFMGQAQSWKIIMDLLANANFLNNTFSSSFPRRRESRNQLKTMDSRLRGNDHLVDLMKLRKGLNTFRCIAFDLPGHGASLFSASDRLNKLRDMEDTARLILEDLDTLGVERFALYGYSMGGRIAQHIAIAAPERIACLILESASFGIADLSVRKERLKNDQSLLSQIKTQDDFRIFLDNWYNMSLFQTLPGTAHLQNLIEDKVRHPVAEFQRALNLLSVGGHDFLAEKLAACRIPIHYFCGEKDEAYCQTANETQKALPAMTVTIVPNASHNISLQYPQEIARAIGEILI